MTTLGTSEASKAVTVDSNGDLLVPDSDKYKFGAGSDMQLYHDGSNSYITNATGTMKVATESSGIAVTIGHTTSETTVGDNLTVTGDAAVTGDLTISSASKGINTTSGSNVAHDEASSTTLTANNNRRGKYTFTTNATVADNDHSAKFTVANNTATSDDIVVMNCTSNHQIEVHTFNISSSGWDFIIVNRSGGVLAADTDLVFNFIVLQ